MHYLWQRIKCAIYGHEDIHRHRGTWHVECIACLRASKGVKLGKL